MRLFCYYALCSVKNQIKKLFHTWVAVFLAVCILFGAAIGIGAAMLEEALAGDVTDEEETTESTETPEESEEETPLPEEPLDRETMLEILELGVGAVALVILLMGVFNADKGGSSIFQMADVNLLFAAPLKPQSVLLFRLMSQILLLCCAGFYFLLNVPTLTRELELGAGTSVAIALAWISMLVYSKLLNVLIYTLCSTREKLKKYIRPVLYALIAVLLLAFFATRDAEKSLLEQLIDFFNAPYTRWLPVYGWLKGMVLFAAEGRTLLSVAGGLLLVAGIPPLAYLIWNMKADFYEEAMYRSEETAERLAAAQEGKTQRRKKERTDRIKRDGLNYGSGASMFFFKSIYNRFRFAKLKVFTKTSVTYLVVTVAVCFIQYRLSEKPSFVLLPLLLAAIVFFRSFGNPLAADADKSCFVTVPANAYEKVFWSLLGGTVDCALDLLPSLVLGGILLGADPLQVLAALLLSLGVDFYAENLMLFIEFSLPTSLGLQIKQAIFVMVLYFGLLPIAAVVLVGVLLKQLFLFQALAAIVAFAVGGVFFAVSPLFLQRGRR